MRGKYTKIHFFYWNLPLSRIKSDFLKSIFLTRNFFAGLCRQFGVKIMKYSYTFSFLNSLLDSILKFKGVFLF